MVQFLQEIYLLYFTTDNLWATGGSPILWSKIIYRTPVSIWDKQYKG